MKAVKTTKYGSPQVLKIVEVNKPIPKNNEILIHVKAIAVTSGDCRMRAFNPPNWYFWIPMRLALGLFKPRRPVQGLWLSGKIEQTGKTTKIFSVGQQVYARTPDLKFGANAEYICLPENCTIGLKPLNLSHEESVSIPFGALTALHFFRKAGINSEDNVLIYGASGAVGIAAVQLGKIFGAEIHAVCSRENMDLVINNGADYVIDYKKKKITDINEKFDIIFDAVGKINKTNIKHLLKDNGKFISVVSSGHAHASNIDLEFITILAEFGKLKPAVDKIYPFEQIAEAHKYVDTGHKKGNVVLTVKTDNA